MAKKPKGWKRALMKLGCCIKMRASILVVGLANSGKTTVVSNLSAQPAEAVVPTLGFSMERFSYQGTKLTVADMSGATKYRNIWEHYYSDTQGIVFVVDAAERPTFAEARGVLDSIMSRTELKGLPLLVLCNKQDLPTAVQAVDVAVELGLNKVQSWTYHLSGCSAIKGEGVHEGVHWLLKQVKAQL